MEEKKIGIASKVLLGIVILAIGIGVGYIIARQITDKKVTDALQALEEKNAQIQANTSASSNVQNLATVKQYNSKKSVTVEGKTFKISYNNKTNEKKYEVDGETYTYNTIDTTIYVNDKEIKTFKDIEVLENKDYNNMMEVGTILGDGATNKKYIVVTFKVPKATDVDTYLVIINQEGQLVGTILGQPDNVSITTADKWQGPNYQLNENNIMLYEILNDGQGTQIGNTTQYGAARYKITIRDNMVIKNIEKVYSQDEVQFAGK